MQKHDLTTGVAGADWVYCTQLIKADHRLSYCFLISCRNGLEVDIEGHTQIGSSMGNLWNRSAYAFLLTLASDDEISSSDDEEDEVDEEENTSSKVDSGSNTSVVDPGRSRARKGMSKVWRSVVCAVCYSVLV